MKNTRTFTMIKPDAVQNKYTGQIITHIENAGFKIIAMKLRKLSTQQAQYFYQVHKERPFFNDLIKYITSGPIIAAVLEKEYAVEDFRKLIGSTNPEDADEGTIRKLYAKSIDANAIHGSDSDEMLKLNLIFIFKNQKLFNNHI